MNAELPDQFHTTRWTRVAAARGDSDESRAALSELCEAYYGPVEKYLLYTAANGNPDEARELTHAFFAVLLERRGSGIDGASKSLGKFRSYLLGAVKNFLRDRTKYESAQRRAPDYQGSGARTKNHAAIDEGTPPPDDAFFDREWALAILGRAIDQVANDSQRFEVLKPWLTGDAGHLSQVDAAAALGMTEGAVKVAIHRMRKQLRNALETEIAETVESKDEIKAELRYLASALG